MPVLGTPYPSPRPDDAPRVTMKASVPRAVAAALLSVLLPMTPLIADSLAAQSPRPAAAAAAAQPPIQDNSFLIEEAYNQEAGVVQHIGVFTRATEGPHWSYAFTQEWPLFGQRHQLSYTIPLATASDGSGVGAGLGDAQLHYRYQLASGGSMALAPRLSLLLPTGDERRGRGDGAAGVQTNLPVSVEVTRALVVHWNAGVTHTPSARDAAGNRASATAFNLGQGLVWLAAPTVNLLLETVWERGEAVIGPGRTAWESVTVLSPGIRGAFNFESGLQIVPGIAVPFEIARSRTDATVLVYLSVEHAFRR